MGYAQHASRSRSATAGCSVRFKVSRLNGFLAGGALGFGPVSSTAGSIERNIVGREEVRGIIANPVYAGIGPFPQLVSDEQWIRAAAKAIRANEPEQFLVNMLHVLRQSLKETKVVP